jgi:hypothetical protein
MGLDVRLDVSCGDLSVEATTGDANMTRRKKTPHDDHTLDMLTWLFAGLVVVAAIAGMIGGITH